MLLINSSLIIEKDFTIVLIASKSLELILSRFSDNKILEISVLNAFLNALSTTFSLLKFRSYGSIISTFFIKYVCDVAMSVEKNIKILKKNIKNTLIFVI